MPGHEVYKLTPEQNEAWRKAVAPLEAPWAADVTKNGNDPKAVMESLRSNLAKYKPVSEPPEAHTMTAADTPLKAPRSPMDRFIDAIEWNAAIFVGIVALNIFLAVVLRKFFSTSTADGYDMGTLIFWGIAATSYRGSHITVDLVWSAASPRHKRWIEIFATLVLLFVVTVQA